MSQSSPTLPGAYSVVELLELGLGFHRSGQLAQAQSAYHRLLEIDPAHVRTLYLLGMTYAQQGKFDSAIRCFEQALTAKSDYFDALYNLGNVYTEVGNSARAVQTLRQAISLQPEHGGAHYALGNALRNAGQTVEAISSFRRAIRYQPQFAMAHNNLGNLLAAQGDYRGAVESLRCAAALAPDEWLIQSSLSAALYGLGHLEEATAACRCALSLQPENISLHTNLAQLLWAQGKLVEARHCLEDAHRRLKVKLKIQQDGKTDIGHIPPRVGNSVTTSSIKPDVESLLTLGKAFQALCDFGGAGACYRQALAFAPNYAEAHADLGRTCWTLGELTEAETCFRRALQLKPDLVGAQIYLSSVLSALNRLDESLASAQRAVELGPDSPEAHHCLGQILLKRGDYAQGWPNYDHIHLMDISTPRHFTQPRWDGADLHGRTILIHSQFGLGDTLQCVRYLPLVKARGGRVLFECQWELASLLQNSAGFDQMLVRTPACGNRVPECAFDLQFNLISLPALFQADETTIPANVPYVHVDAKRRERWRGRIEPIKSLGQLTVGIVWAASTEGLRSCRALDFAPLSTLPGVALIGLQKGLEARQVADLPSTMHLHDFGPEIGDFADTAAILTHLDLVITVDTSVAHLAGAMNIPVWTLLPFGADWRWQREREDTPWYPSMRLFRQARPGDWNSVFAQAEKAVAEKAVSKSSAANCTI